MRIAITGANSSVGQSLLRHLAAAADVEVRAGVRTEQAAATLPERPTITPCVVDYDRPDTLAALLAGAGCLVHLAGILIERARSSYQTANVDATAAVVAAGRAAGVEHLVLVSALGADPASPNAYYRSKGEAERLVAESGLAATIIRTPILLGSGTAGAKALVAMASRPSVRLLGGGHHLLRPLDVDDLCAAIVHSCRTPAAGVSTHELVGPDSIAHRDLIAATARLLGGRVSIGALPVGLAKLGAAVVGWFRAGGMTPAVLDVITADETVAHNADAALGVTLTPLTATLAKLVPGKANH